MKIAYVTTEYPTENIGGGQSRYLENVTSLMADHGHKVYVFVKSDRDEEFVWKDSIVVVRVKCEYKSRLVRRFLGRYEISYHLNKRVNSYHHSIQFDVIQYSNLQGIPVCLNRNNPSIVRLSDFAPLCDLAFKEDYHPEELRLDFDQKQKLRALRRAKRVFGPSRVCAELTSKYIGREVDVIESPISICSDMKKPNNYDEIISGREYFLFFGSLNFLKGLRVICDLADTFLDMHPDHIIVFLGANCRLKSRNGANDAYSYIDKTVKRNRDRIITIEPISEKEYLNYYIANAEACIMPSRIDNLPNTCIEAMSLGKIVIGTRNASYEQLIEDGVNGFLADIDDPDQLLDKMNGVCDISDNEKKSISENAKLITERMNPDLICDRLITLYEEVIRITQKNYVDMTIV